MNCRTDILKDFDSRTEAMGLNCPSGNAEGMRFNDLVLHGQAPVHVGGVITCSIVTYIMQVIVPLCKLGSGHTRL